MKNPPEQDVEDHGMIILYDGQCPLCASYVRMTRLRQSAGQVTLVDARGTHPAIAEARAQGLALNEGMVVKLDGKMHHGAEAMVLLSAMTTRSGLFNRFMRYWFASRRRARLTYPALVRGRLLLLRLLGRRPLAD